MSRSDGEAPRTSHAPPPTRQRGRFARAATRTALLAAAWLPLQVLVPALAGRALPEVPEGGTSVTVIAVVVLVGVWALAWKLSSYVHTVLFDVGKHHPFHRIVMAGTVVWVTGLIGTIALVWPLASSQ